MKTIELPHTNLEELESLSNEFRRINNALQKELSKLFVEEHFSPSNILWFATSIILFCTILVIHCLVKKRRNRSNTANQPISFI
jgi:hypothetical protein